MTRLPIATAFFSFTLAACPRTALTSVEPLPPIVAAPAPSLTFETDLHGEMSLAFSGDGQRLAVFSVDDDRLAVYAPGPEGMQPLADFALPQTVTTPQMVWSPDGQDLFLSGTTRATAERETRPMQAIVHLAGTPSLTLLDEYGYPHQVAWGRQGIVLADATVTELDPRYGTPNDVRRCTPATCGTIDRAATRVVTGDETTLANVRTLPSLSPGATLEHVSGNAYLGQLGPHAFLGAGVDGVRAPVWSIDTGEVIAAVAGLRHALDGDYLVSSSRGDSASELELRVLVSDARVRLAFPIDGPWFVGGGRLAIVDDERILVWELSALAALAKPMPTAPLAAGVDASAVYAVYFTRGTRFETTRDPQGHALARAVTCRVVWSGTWREDDPIPASWFACRDARAPNDASVEVTSIDRWAGLWVVRHGVPQRAEGRVMTRAPGL